MRVRSWQGPTAFAVAEVVYLFAVAALGVELGVDDRKRLYRLIAAAWHSERRRRSSSSACTSRSGRECGP